MFTRDFLCCINSKLKDGLLRSELGENPTIPSTPQRLSPGAERSTSRWGNLLFLNVTSFSSGIMNIWRRRNKSIGKDLLPQQMDDGKVEVLGIHNWLSLAALQMYLRMPSKIGQIEAATYFFEPDSNSKVSYVQFDGEPKQITLRSVYDIR